MDEGLVYFFPGSPIQPDPLPQPALFVGCNAKDIQNDKKMMVKAANVLFTPTKSVPLLCSSGRVT